MKVPKSTPKPKELAPKGTHPFRIQGVIDIGTQKPRNEKFAVQRKVLIFLELVKTNHVFKGYEEKGEQPYVMKQEYGFVLSNYNGKRSNLLQFLDGMKGELLSDAQIDKVDLKRFINVGGKCIIAHAISEKTGNPYDKVMTIYPLEEEEKSTTPPLRNRPMFFSIDEPTKEDWATLHDWIKKTIRESAEWPKIASLIEPQTASAEPQEPRSAMPAQDDPFA